MVISTHKIQIVTEYLQKGLAKTREGYKNFNRGLVVSTERMKEIQTKQGKWNKGMKESRTVAGRAALSIRKATHGLRGFRMEMLGVMFFGMMLQRAFSGLIKTSLDWMGVTEIMTFTLGILFLPVAEMMLTWALWFLKVVNDLSPAQKKWIGYIVLTGIAIGGLLFLIGTFALGVGSIILVFGALLSPILLIIAAFMALAGFLIIKDYFKDVGDAAKVADIKLAAFGLTGNPINSLLNGLKEKLPLIRDFFINLIDKIGEWIGENLPKLIQSGGKLVMGIIGGIRDNASKIGDAIGTLINNIFTWIDNNVDSVLAAGMEILDKIVQGIADNSDKISEALEAIVTSMLTWIENNAGALFEIGASIAKGILLGLWSWLADKIPQIIGGVLGAGAGFAVGGPVGAGIGLAGGIAAGTAFSGLPSVTTSTSTGGQSIPNFTIAPQYNVVVSDKSEFMTLMEENNRTLTEDVRRVVGG